MTPQENRERLLRAIQARKLGSFRLTEFLDENVVHAAGLSMDQFFIELMWALSDFDKDDFIERD